MRYVSGKGLVSKAAEKRAKALAASEPGKVYEIVQTIGEVACSVGQPKVKKL